MIRWVREEGRMFLRTVGDWRVWCLLVPFLVGCWLLVCRPLRLAVDVGARLEAPRPQPFTHLIGRFFDHRVGRPIDEAYLSGVYAGESENGVSFRWTEERAALVVHGMPGGTAQVSLRLKGAVDGRTRLRVTADGHLVAQLPVGPHWQEYVFVVPQAWWRGDCLRLELRATPYRTGGVEDRIVGVAIDRVFVEGWGDGRGVLPWTALWLTVALLAAYGGLQRAGVTGRLALCAMALLALLVLIVLAGAGRPFLSAYAPRLLVALVCSWVVAAITLGVGRHWLGGSTAPGEREWCILGVVVLAAFALRFGGALSPRFSAHDALFHVHRLEAIEKGELFFEHVSLEWGMRNDPYPGALYLLLAPLRLVYGNGEHLLAFATAWMDAVSILAVWYLAEELVGRRAALWASCLYAFMPIGFAANWAGIYTNLFGYDTLLLLSAALAMAWKRSADLRALRWVPLWTVHLLSHFGTVVLGIPWFLTWTGWWWRCAEPRQRQWLRRLVLLWAAALGFALLLYYSHFAGTMVHGARSLLAEKATELGTPDATLPTRWAAFQVWWRWGAVVDYAGIGLFLGALGWLSIGKRERLQPERAWLFASLGVAAVFWAVSRVLFLSVRTMLFLLPAVAIGVGALLARLAARGRPGKAVALLVAAYVCVLGVSIWLGVCFAGLRPPHVY